MARVPLLMREHQQLAPQRQFEPVEVRTHDGTIATERPNQMWGIDGTATHTIADGQVTIFAAIDHCSADCISIHAAKPATRLEALEPLRQGVKQYCIGFHKGTASGIRLRHDHGSQFMRDDLQNEVRFLGMESSPAVVRQPEGTDARVTEIQKDALRKTFHALDPVRLLSKIRKIQHELTTLEVSNSDAKVGVPERHLDRFVDSLATAWKHGEVRPTHRRRSTGPR